MNERIIFEKALDYDDPDLRANYIDAACGQNTELRSRVNNLLHSHEQSHSFLQGAAVAVTADIQFDANRVGTQIGPYKLREQIGEGGMGVVYVAEQSEPVKRKVALKIIKPGMASKDVLARFEAERQALAMMDHPNIAKVHDGGATETGEPYFVMELVQGLPITEYCDKHKLNTRERLELFENVCRAVQHAHQKGVIHRDLKPTNVLVSRIDGQPVPKVIDFGVSKATGQKLTDQTVYTQFSQLVGTPLYMSPEQAELGVIDIDTRSDVYSLGVLLYELLTGNTPFDSDTLKQAGFDEMRRIIREDEPARPSDRVSTLAAEDISTIAASRGSEPRQLSASLKGELDWLVMKALEKDRNRRYESPSALAADVDRFLAGAPVEACPPSALYQFKKIVRRNKATIATVAVVLATLITGIVGTSWQAWRANEAFAAAEINLAQSEEQRDRYLSERDQALHNLYVADVRLAHREWEGGHGAAYSALLDAHKPNKGDKDFRGWEWYYLKSRGMQEIASINGRSMGSYWNKAGTHLATVQDQDDWRTLVVRNATTMEETHRFSGHKNPIAEFSWSPNGKRLVSNARNDSLRVWDLDSNRCVWSVPQPFGPPVFCTSWSPDGSRIASSGSHNDGPEKNLATVVIRDAATGKKQKTLVASDKNLYWCIRWSPDGSRIAASGSDHAIFIWEVDSGRQTRRLNAPNHYVRKVSWSPDGESFAAASGDTVTVWNATDWEERWSQRVHRNVAYSVAWSPDSKLLASSGAEGLVKTWDSKGTVRGIYRGHQAAVEDVAWRQDGGAIASTSMDGVTKVWDPAGQHTPVSGSAVCTAGWLPTTEHTVFGIVDMPDSDYRGIQHWQPNDWVPGTRRRILVGDVTPAKFGSDGMRCSPDGKQLLSWRHYNEGLKFDLIDPETGGCAPLLPGFYKEGRFPMHASWAPDQRQIALLHREGARIWNIDEHRITKSLHFGRAISVEWSPDGKRVAIASRTAQVVVYDTSDWAEVFRGDVEGHYLLGNTPPRMMSWTDDGKELVVGSTDGDVVVWEADSWKPRIRWSAHTSAIHGVAINRSRNRLATASRDGFVKVWDFSTGALLLSLDLAPEQAWRVEWSPDETCLFATQGVNSRKFWVWDASAAMEAEHAKQAAPPLSSPPESSATQSRAKRVRE